MNTFNVFADIGRWYAGDSLLLPTLFSQGFSVSNETEIVTNVVISEERAVLQEISTNTYQVAYPDPNAPKPVLQGQETAIDLMAALEDAVNNPGEECDCIKEDLAGLTGVNDLRADMESTKTIVQTWESFLDGSNVVFSITNYISGTYNLDAAKLRIMELRDGAYREVYNSRDEINLHINDFKEHDLADAIREVDSRISAKADKAWGRYTSTGGEAPLNTIYMTEPSTVFAGGMEYERVAVGEGAIAVLTTKGAPVYTQGDEGTFKFQDDGGTNYFGFAKTDSYTIGCNTDGITVQSQIVTLTYDITMSGVPCVWYCPSLDVMPLVWEQLNTPDGEPIAGASHIVSWEQNPPVGKEICYINCPEPKGFFKATVEVAGDAKFMTNMPADLGGGILCTDGKHKVKIDWNNGNPRLVGVQ